MNIEQPRKYEMTKRAESAAKTGENILNAIAELWRDYSLYDITLELIAEKAGVSVRTILRKYGSKEGLFEASLKVDPAGLKSIKDEAIPGNIDQIVGVLIREYELYGNASIRTLAIEGELEFAAKIIEKGKKMHMAWCERVFAPFLPIRDDAHYREKLGAFYATTDVYVWKRLRKDLGYSIEETTRIMKMTLKGLIYQ